MTLSFIPNNAFPLPASIAPKLIALGLDDSTAAKVSKVYLSSAVTLRRMLETEYTNACTALLATSDNRGYSSKELRAKLLTVSITRYMQALSKCLDESIGKAEASLSKNTKKTVRATREALPSPVPSQNDSFEGGGMKCTPPRTNCPLHCFPRTYPPPVRPESVSFVTHIPLMERKRGFELRTTSDSDLDECIDAFSRLSLGLPSPRTASLCSLSKTTSKSRHRARTTARSKITPPFSPSRPRLVTPMLDTSTAVSQKPLPKSTPRACPPPIAIPRAQNIDIPRSNRRRTPSIPYLRQTTHSPTSGSPPPPYFSRSICRTPSLVSDHGSEASSPSTPPDIPCTSIFASIPTPKSTFPGAITSLEHSLLTYTETGWQDIDFGTDFYG